MTEPHWNYDYSQTLWMKMFLARRDFPNGRSEVLISFEQALTLAAMEKQIVKLNPENTPQLLMQNPHLWWPNGYGEQYLYDVALSFDINGQTSDETNFKTGNI